MPEINHYAFETTISCNIDFLGSWTAEILAFAKATNLWYAIKHEDTGILHIHYASVNEILTGSAGTGGKRCSNYNVQIKNACPLLAEYILTHGNKYTVETHSMKSDFWITNYMNKQSSMVYYNLPQDTLELKRYFSDLQKDKDPNPGPTRWAKMYKEDGREMPASPHSCWMFFSYHMEIKNDLPTCNDVVLKDRCRKLPIRINQEIPDASPFLKAPTSKLLLTHTGWSDSGSELKLCPRCYAPGNDPTNHLVEKNHMYCSDCVKH